MFYVTSSSPNIIYLWSDYAVYDRILDIVF